MWLIVVLVMVLAVIGGYIVHLLLQRKSTSEDNTASSTISENIFSNDLGTIQIKHPLFVELKAAIQQHIVGMDGFINGLLVALLVKGHVLVE